MFEYLKGTLVENHHLYAVIDVHGVGYKVWVPPSTFNEPTGQDCTLYTSFVVRENSQALYGFVDASSRNLFEILLNISGIGPKTAVCILSQFSPESFQDAIISDNISLISSVPGLGKRTAEKIVIELKDKFLKSPISGKAPKASHSKHSDAIAALIHLGFSEKAAAKAIEKVSTNSPEPLELSEMIAQALQSR